MAHGSCGSIIFSKTHGESRVFLQVLSSLESCQRVLTDVPLAPGKRARRPAGAVLTAAGAAAAAAAPGGKPGGGGGGGGAKQAAGKAAKRAAATRKQCPTCRHSWLDR